MAMDDWQLHKHVGLFIQKLLKQEILISSDMKGYLSNNENELKLSRGWERMVADDW